MNQSISVSVDVQGGFINCDGVPLLLMRNAFLTLVVVLLTFTVLIGLSIMMPLVNGDSDHDGDGIADSIDLYPFDRDNDGIRDSRDMFPDYDAALKVDFHSFSSYSNPYGLEGFDIQIIITLNGDIMPDSYTPSRVISSNITDLNLTKVIDMEDNYSENALSFAVLATHPTNLSLSHYLNLNNESEQINVSYIFINSPTLNVSASTSSGVSEDLIDASINFTVSVVPLSINRTLSWEFEGESYEVELNIKMHEFYFYNAHNIPRYFTTDANVGTFITASDAIINSLVQDVKKLFMSNWTEYQKAGLLLAMVQSLEYQTDNDTSGHEEYWRFPVETLFWGYGDCEDSSFFLASLYKNLDYQCVVLLFYPQLDLEVEGHMAVAVNLSDYSGPHYTLDDGKYYYAETTGEGFLIGEVPGNYSKVNPIIIRV